MADESGRAGLSFKAFDSDRPSLPAGAENLHRHDVATSVRHFVHRRRRSGTEQDTHTIAADEATGPLADGGGIIRDELCRLHC